MMRVGAMVTSCVFSLVMTGCTDFLPGRDRLTKPAVGSLRKTHGIAIGNRLTPIRLPCSDGLNRTVGAGKQLVTFARLEDYCELCHHHLWGVAELWRENNLGAEPVLVAYVPSTRRAEAIREFRNVPGASLCFDEGGVLWRQNHLVETPFTVLLIDGRIAYASDAPLDIAAERVAFLHSLQ